MTHKTLLLHPNINKIEKSFKNMHNNGYKNMHHHKLIKEKSEDYLKWDSQENKFKKHSLNMDMMKKKHYKNYYHQHEI